MPVPSHIFPNSIPRCPMQPNGLNSDADRHVGLASSVASPLSLDRVQHVVTKKDAAENRDW